ncbi:MAG: hypothetical protein KA369_22735 [Spirochaetes bacterium]|nr:hypothetical protein [Spirochaetota bacterium]
MKKALISIIYASLLATAFPSCGLFPRTATISDSMPRETDVPGWTVERQYRTRSARKIGQFSALYGEHRPAELAITEYARLSDKSMTVRVEMIRLGSVPDAFGFFTRERGLGGSIRFIDDNTYVSERGLFSRIGNYYLKISHENLGEQEGNAAEQFLGVVRENLKNLAGDEPLPEHMLIFANRRSTREIIYYKGDVDGIPGLKDAVVARRSLGAKKYDLVWAMAPSAYDAEQEYLDILKRGGSAYVLTRIGKLQPAIRIVSETEYVYICQYKQWIFGVLNADTMKEGNLIIGYMLTEIKNRAGK